MESIKPENDFAGKKYRPVTLTLDPDHYFVGVYDERGFMGLHSIHDKPWEAIEAADAANAKEVK